MPFFGCTLDLRQSTNQPVGYVFKQPDQRRPREWGPNSQRLPWLWILIGLGANVLSFHAWGEYVVMPVAVLVVFIVLIRNRGFNWGQ